MFDFSPVSKAIAGGLITALVGFLAHYGLHPKADTITALGAITTIVISYLVGHVVVFLAPKNTPKI